MIGAATLLRLVALVSVVVAAGIAAEGVTVLDPAIVVGGVAHPGDPALPPGRPTGTLLARSRSDTNAQLCEIRDALPGGSTLTVLVHAGTKPRDLRVIALDAAGKRKEIARGTLTPGTWQPFSATVPAGLDAASVLLVAPGTEPFWITAAAVRSTGEPRLSDLAVLPNPLLPLVYEGSLGVPQICRVLAAAPLPGTTIRVLLPGTGSDADKAAGERLLNAITSGWNILPPPNPPKAVPGREVDAVIEQPKPVTVGADSLRWYATPAALGAALDASLAQLPQILVISLATNRSPSAKPDAFAKLMTQANRAGVMVAVVLDGRPDDAKLRRDWQQWLTTTRRAAPALGIIDQQVVNDWYLIPGSTANADHALLGEAIDHDGSLAIGFADLRARHAWLLFEARVELLPDRRRRGYTP